MKIRANIVKLLLLGSISVGVFAQGPSKQEAITTAYTNVSIIDGTGAAMQPNKTLVVKGDKIVSVSSASSSNLNDFDRANVVDASGQYVIPGLIDTHVHLATLPNEKNAKATLRRYVYSGITSVRDMAGDARALAALSRSTLLNEFAGSDIYYAALMAGPSFYKDPRPAMSAQGGKPGFVPWMQSITADTNMPLAVARAKGTWATGIKIYANMPASDVRRIAAEGRKQDIKVWAHSMVFPAFPRDVVDAGVDAISHVCRLAFEISKEKPTEYHHTVVPDYESLDPSHPKITAIFDTMRKQGTILDATVWLYAYLEELREANPEAKTIPVKCPSSFAAALTKIAHERGVEISTGTDGDTPMKEAYPALFKEIEMMVHQVGMTPSEAIRSATLVGAMTIGKDESTGTIKVGKNADLVFLARNPLTDISNLKSVVRTLKRGVVFDRTNFRKAEK
ncbi:MAG: amidohydrolase family protein [Kordiimonas sp.]